MILRNLLKAAWFIACTAIFVWVFITCGQESNSTLRGECSLLLAGVMAFLTLPSGILWWLLISGGAYVFSSMGIEVRASAFADIFVWLGFAVIGYFQWFKLVPLLIRRFQERKQATR